MIKYHIPNPFQGNCPINCSLQSRIQLALLINKSFIFVTKKGCILSAPVVSYNFDTQHAEFMNYIQMTTKISANNTLAAVIRLLPDQTQGRFTATLNYGTKYGKAQRRQTLCIALFAPRYRKSNCGNSCSLRCRKQFCAFAHGWARLLRSILCADWSTFV